MPKQTRDQIKRHAAYIRGCIERCEEHMQILHQRFEPVHPEHAAVLVTCVEGLDVVDELFTRWCECVLGEVPEMLDRWRE